MSDNLNNSLHKAKDAKNDEFYTQYHDIEHEMQAYLEYDANVFRDKTILLPCDDPEWSNFTKYFAQNFERFGIKKLISTSYAPASKGFETGMQPSLLELNDERFDEEKHETKGKIFTVSRDINNDSKTDINDLEWAYLEGDGDFRSDEVTNIAQDSDLIITNPPFSLFREFLAWIVDLKKDFSIIGNMNAITYKEVFPLIKYNEIWLGRGFQSGNAYFATPDGEGYAKGVFDSNTGLVKFRNCVWFTNIEHGRRHEPLQLMSMQDNLRFNKKVIRNKKDANTIYCKYDNYDAIEVGHTDAIPNDYKGIMGVPISFLDKYNPEQFEILGMTTGRDEFGIKPSKRYVNAIQHNKDGTTANGSKANTRATILLKEAPSNSTYYTADNQPSPMKIIYARILIKHITSKKRLENEY